MDRFLRVRIEGTISSPVSFNISNEKKSDETHTQSLGYWYNSRYIEKSEICLYNSHPYEDRPRKNEQFQRTSTYVEAMEHTQELLGAACDTDPHGQSTTLRGPGK